MTSNLPEAQRLKALRELNILDTLPEEDYDQLSRLAAQVAQVPIAYISFIDDRREWFKSRIGIQLTEIPKEQSVAELLLKEPGDYLLLNEKQNAHSLLSRVPKITGKIKFFLSLSIKNNAGHVLGSLCVVDHVVRELQEPQLQSLRYIAGLISEKVQNRNNAARKMVAETTQTADQVIRTLSGFLPNVLLRTALNGEIMQISDSSLAILGYSPNELLGKSFANLYADPSERLQLIDDLRSYGYVTEFCTRLKCKNGSLKHISINARAVTDNGGDMTGIEGFITDITRFVESRKEIEAVKEFYEKTLNAISADIAVLDSENKYYFLNTHAVKNEQTRKDLIGKTNAEYFAEKNKSPELANLRQSVLNEVSTSENKVEWLEQYVDSAGDQVYKLCIGEKFTTSGGKIFKVAYGIDVTKLKETQKKLSENERYLSSLIHSIPDLILRLNDKGEYLDFKSDQEGLLALAPADILGKTLFDLFDNDTAEMHLELIHQALAGKKTVTYEYSMNVGNENHFFEARLTRINNTEVVALVRDISERKTAERQIQDYTKLLRERESSLKQLIYGAPKGIMVLNKMGRVILWNPMCEKIFCVREKEMQGKEFAENFLEAAEQKDFLDALVKVKSAANSLPPTIEMWARNQCQQDVAIQIMLSESQIEGQQVITAFISDITHAKEAELQLSKRQTLLVEAHAIAKMASFEWNVRTDEVVWSPNVRNLLEINENVQINFLDTLYRFIHLDDIKMVRERLDRISNPETTDPLHFRIITGTGKTKYLVANGQPLLEEGETTDILIGTVQDITEQKLFDKQLFKTVIDSEERERNRIAAELHDGVCQDLAASKLGLEMALKTCTADPEMSRKLVQQSFEGVTIALERTSRVSHELLPGDLKNEGLAKSIENLATKLNSLGGMSYTVNIEGFVKDPEPLIAINLYRITQEFVRNSQKHSGATELKIHLTFLDNKLQLKLKDNGKGFDMQTVKSDGIGFINMSKRIESIGGTFNIAARPGKGVLLSLSVPFSS